MMISYLLPTIVSCLGVALGALDHAAIIDHHLHVLSPRLIADWKAAGARFSRDDESYSNPRKFCDANNIAKGFLISMAHLYTSDDFGTKPNSAKERKRVAAENDFVAQCVSAAPDRFVGFFSVNPLRDWAAAEMERCRKKTGLRGLKLHLPACGMHLGDKEHVALLRRTFAWCARSDVPLLVHLSGFRRTFGAVEAQIFWQELVKPHPELHLYVAHIGASGGYNDRSEALFHAYRKLLSNSPELTKSRIFFDLSGAILAEAVDGIEPTTKERCRQLADQIRAIGFERFVFASDYPVFSPKDYIAALKEHLPLRTEEFEKMLQTHSPLFSEKVTAWKRHTIDASSRGADGVRLADINGDGLPDCVTGWEEGGVIRVCLHPGHENARNPWPAVEVGRVNSPEDAVFGDMDGDGHIDVISCCEGKQRCVFLHLAPDRKQLLNSDAWQTIPIKASEGKQWMYALPSHIDADKQVDFFAGSKGTDACIAWFSAPDSPRDPRGWQMHKIANAGWIMSMVTRDMNADGLDDLIVSDRRGKTRGVHWFEHPGLTDPRKPWRRHTLGGAQLECMFLTLADLDQDGKTDVVCNVKGDDILFLRNNGQPSNWEPHRIGHNLRTGGGKGIAVDDVDGDGTNDLLLTCEGANQKIGAFWLKAKGSVLDRHWTGHDISGKASGIKYDLIELIDIDGDGDRDLLTCEERDNLGVIWYEHP